MPRLTKQIIDNAKPGEKDILLFDTEIRGFLCKITPKGRKVYMLYYRTVDGRQRKPAIGIHGAITCEQARQIAKSWYAENIQGKDPSLNKTQSKKEFLLEDLAKKYIEEYALNHKKEYSVTIDKVQLKNHILPKLGKLKLVYITSNDISDFHHNLTDRPITANRCLAILSKMFNLAEKLGLRDDASSLCKHIKKYKENKHERFLSIEEIEKLGNALKEVGLNKTEPENAIAAVRLLLLTGCRLSKY